MQKKTTANKYLSNPNIHLFEIIKYKFESNQQKIYNFNIKYIV